MKTTWHKNAAKTSLTLFLLCGLPALASSTPTSSPNTDAVATLPSTENAMSTPTKPLSQPSEVTKTTKEPRMVATEQFQIGDPMPLRAADPKEVTIWFSGARISAKETLVPSQLNQKNMSLVRFVVPKDADNIHIQASGGRLVRWNVSPCFLPAQGKLAHERQADLEMLRSLETERDTHQALLSFWRNAITTSDVKNLEALSDYLSSVVPDSRGRLYDVERSIAAIREVAKARKPLSDQGQMVTVWLSDAAEKVDLSYSYTLPNCGWEPRYVLDAQLAESQEKQDRLNIRLEAAVWQYSGMDWSNSRIRLSLQPESSRTPRPLPRWIVTDQPQRPMPRAAAMPQQAAVMAAAPLADAQPEANAAPYAAPMQLTSQSHAVWDVPSAGMSQGRNMVFLKEESITLPQGITRIARPSEHDSQVWLMAETRLPENIVWPKGQATVTLDGIPTGDQFINPESDGTLKLYFGVDPQVRIEVLADTERRGDAGVINRQRQWNWAWTYTIHNTRNTPVQVTLERPQAQIVDRDVTVQYENDPTASLNDKDKSLVWRVEVPANGSSTVRHGLRITAPASKKDLHPRSPL